MNSVASLVFLWRTYERVPGSDSFTVAIICFAAASNSASLPGCTFNLAITVIGIVGLLEVSNSSTLVTTCARFFKAREQGEADRGAREARDYRDRNRVRVKRTCPRPFLPSLTLPSSGGQRGVA